MKSGLSARLIVVDQTLLLPWKERVLALGDYGVALLLPELAAFVDLGRMPHQPLDLIEAAGNFGPSGTLVLRLDPNPPKGRDGRG
jgi:hypothetical protein